MIQLYHPLSFSKLGSGVFGRAQLSQAVCVVRPAIVLLMV